MDLEERQEKIELYGSGFEALMEALDDFPEEMRQFRPAPGEWSVHDIIIHLADSEANAAMRARMIIAQPSGTLMVYDQDVWAKNLNYHSQDIEDALQLLKYSRLTTYKLLKNLPEGAWTHKVNHPEFANGYSVDRLLQIYAGHVHGHIQQMRDNLAAWEAQKE